MKVKTIIAASAVAFAWGASATARAADDGNYISIMGLGYMADDRLHMDNGYGGRGLIGVPLADSLNLEVSAFGYDSNPNHKEYVHWGQYGLGLDFMVPLTKLNGFTPYFLIGGGYDHSDGGGFGKLNNTFANAGGGALFDLGGGVSLRAEARYVALFPDGSPASKEDLPHGHYNDTVIGLGLQYNFGRVQEVAPPPPAPPPPPPPAPPPRPKDTDGDGVLDTVDQCPNTPKGVQVDVRGCPLDSDRDGVPDYLDKCPNTTYGLKVDATGCVHEAQTIVLQNVNFEFNKDTLTTSSLDILRSVAKGLVSQPDLRVEIAGHTDSKGTDAYNKNLSERRAASVRRYLLSQGVLSSQLVSHGYGESQPVASNDTEEGRAQNRRVEFRVLKK